MADWLDLRKDIQFNTRVDGGRYNEAPSAGRHDRHRRTIQAQYVISCAGMLSAPLAERFPGQDQFKGQILHTGRWPKKAVDFKGKRVGGRVPARPASR